MPNRRCCCLLLAVNAYLLSSCFTGVYRWLAVSHGYQHLPEDDLSGCPEPVQLCGGGEPGCRQGSFGQVQRCGQQERCKSAISQQAHCWLRTVGEDYAGMKGSLRLCNKCSVGKGILDFASIHKKYCLGLGLSSIIILITSDIF